MITDAELAGLCLAIYARADGPQVHWDHFDAGADDGVCWGLYRSLGADVIVLRGSVTLLDWIRDFSFIGNPRTHPELKDVHFGFTFGMDAMWAEAKAMVGQNAIVIGHSLGGGRADVLTAKMALEGRAPLARVVFGEPMPGYRSFSDIVAKVPGRSYCNGDAGGHDLVTEVPFPIPDFPYVHPTPLISVSASPPAGARGAFRYHDMALYFEALRKPSQS